MPLQLLCIWPHARLFDHAIANGAWLKILRDKTSDLWSKGMARAYTALPLLLSWDLKRARCCKGPMPSGPAPVK